MLSEPIAKFLEISRAAYPHRLHRFESWVPDSISEFCGDSFYGFVASNKEMVVVCFRGTSTDISSLDNLILTVKNWLTNLNYSQITKGDYRVHAGFSKELDSAYDKIVSLILRHRRGEIPVYLTGHSAGGALATLAARRLAEESRPIDGVFVYSSPRVGDYKFCSQYPVPLYRFERKDDIIPHTPFPPKVAKFIGNKLLLDKIIEYFPTLSGFRSDKVEYIHAGNLIFCDWEDSLCLSDTWSGVFGKFFRSIDGEKFPYTPIPSNVLNTMRFTSTFLNISNQMDNGLIEFIKDHNLDDFIHLFKNK